MNARAKLDAEERRQELFAAVDWRCVVCGRSLYSGVPQLAHVLGKGKSMLAKYGPEIVHHPLAVVPVERVEPCNSAVLIGDETEPGRALIARIRRILAGEESMPNLIDYYREVGKEVKKGVCDGRLET